MSRITGGLMVLLLVMVLSIAYYQGKVTKLNHDVEEITQVANQRQATIDLMTVKQKLAEELDIKYTKELADAKSENDRLRADVESGAKQLHINAKCKRLPQATGAPSVDDAAAAELTPDARQNYFRLREQLATSEKQILGLQEYINNICLK